VFFAMMRDVASSSDRGIPLKIVVGGSSHPSRDVRDRMTTQRRSRLRIGDWVEVRSRAEILETLGPDGRYEGMPFMPEMLQYCGQRFRVHKLAHKTCDYTTPYPFRLRKLQGTVHLETRCDGSAHGGCQAGCLLYWKEAWLKPVGSDSHDSLATLPASIEVEGRHQCDDAVIFAGTSVLNADGTRRYRCQATEIQDATTPLAWWDVRQYVRDYRSGNVSLGRLVSAMVYSACFHLSEAGLGVGRPMRWFYDNFHWLWGGTRWPRTPGALPRGAPTPAETLNLQPGEWVRVKSHEAILQTVTAANQNRGMYWDAELVPYCGGVYRVLRRVDKLIDEKSGQMVAMKTPCIVLDSVTCQARYSQCRMLCPKGMYPYWREIWLERVSDGAGLQ
jgi:hypothetical protein